MSSPLSTRGGERCLPTEPRDRAHGVIYHRVHAGAEYEGGLVGRELSFTMNESQSPELHYYMKELPTKSFQTAFHLSGLVPGGAVLCSLARQTEIVSSVY